MNITEAVDLIKCDGLHKMKPEIWADLGCGSGLFTRAIASLLPEDSMVYGIDKSISLTSRSIVKNVNIHFLHADFEKEELDLKKLDGILMANSLHYIKDKTNLLLKLKEYLKKSGRFLVIEYDTTHANPWVPYPVNFEQLKDLFSEAGFSSIKKIGKRRSSYGNKNMYSCLIE
jgi:ubiquinone/menaquinone biosynthesis C-methylase UbiE